MIKNIINQNLDQFGLPYGEGQRITPQNFVPTMPMRDPNYGIPSAARDRVAELTESQTDFIDKNKSNLNRGFKEPSYVFDAINNPNLNFFEKNSLNPFKDPQEPTTTKEFNDYLNKIGVDPQYRMPTNTSQSSLVGPGGYPMTAMAIDPNRMTDAYSGFFNTNPTTNRNFDRNFSQLPSYGDAISRPNVQSENYNMDQSFYMNPNSVERPQNMFQRLGGAMQDRIGSMRDFAVDKGMSAKNLLGSGAAYAMGLPGIVGSGAMSLLGGFGNMFEDRQLSGGLGTIVDEYGRSYTAEELNKQNALGGYYTDPARASRRRAKSIFKLGNRKNLSDAGKRRLEKLKAQELIQEKARLEATRTLAAANRATYGTDQATGGYQSSFGGDSDFMDGSGTAAEMGSFRDGGLASMFVRRR